VFRLAFRGAIDEVQVLSVDVTKLIETAQKKWHEVAILARKQSEVRDGERFRFLSASPVRDAEQCGTGQYSHQRPPVRHAKLLAPSPFGLSAAGTIDNKVQAFPLAVNRPALKTKA
jgi:hypothetical protein